MGVINLSKREKVINALLACYSADVKWCQAREKGLCNYNVAHCRMALFKDAAELLKAQEPIEARLNLCESCTKEYAECEADKTDLVYGSGVGNDNIIGCPWYANRWKAQEPRVMTLDEVAALPEGVVVWYEQRSNDGEDFLAAMVTDGRGYIGNGNMGVRIVYMDVGDRCWTSRPTAAEMEATPWE